MQHNCGFQSEIIGLIGTVSETNASVKNLNDKFDELLSIVKDQNKEIDALKNFKNSSLLILVCLGGLTTLIIDLFQGSLGFLIHR